jgi:cytidylate kinase
MPLTRSVDALSSLFGRLEADLKGPAGSAAAASPAVTIAFSREAGSGGAAIAQEVGRLLDWPVYDNELLTRIADEKGLSARMIEHLDERYVSWLEQALHSFNKTGPLAGRYLTGLLRVLATLSKNGRCVIVGRGAPHVLPRETTFSVRVVAPKPWRVAQIQKSKGMTATEAERWVNDTDRERLAFVKGHFRADAADPLLYDLVINGERTPPAEAAALIVQAVHAFEARLAAKARA